ncbi:hypothetical protein [Niabella ginsengisoli]|uniref:Potassium transporter KefB n=1 Tax=Niabella ginsengisoli TaxID=522298 RepID=A0ABS9SPB6_9BACT|nr:hypothetical protein [Niabella ginsengisoli]MCH5600210.1 hypothetical protein [Niabella ginsengisoli]
MTQNQSLSTTSFISAALGRRMLIGAVIAFILIALFVSSVDNPNPAWPRLWVLKPLIIVPIAGAMGGAFYHIMDHLRRQMGFNKFITLIISIIGSIIALWLGSVLGLNGTLWN